MVRSRALGHETGVEPFGVGVPDVDCRALDRCTGPNIGDGEVQCESSALAILDDVGTDLVEIEVIGTIGHLRGQRDLVRWCARAR